MSNSLMATIKALSGSHCSHCGTGNLLQDLDGEVSCLQCGYELTSDPMLIDENDRLEVAKVYYRSPMANWTKFEQGHEIDPNSKHETAVRAGRDRMIDQWKKDNHLTSVPTSDLILDSDGYPSYVNEYMFADMRDDYVTPVFSE